MLISFNPDQSPLNRGRLVLFVAFRQRPKFRRHPNVLRKAIGKAIMKERKKALFGNRFAKEARNRHDGRSRDIERERSGACS